MIHRKRERRLEFESLEAMELLSGAGATAHHAMIGHHAARVHRVPMDHTALNLSGGVQGTYRVAGGGTSASFNGRGPVDPIGKAQLRGDFTFGSLVGGQLTLRFGRRGKIFATVTGGTPASGYTYQITGGTRTFVGDSGTGVAVVNILSSNAAQNRGRFALSLQGSPST